MSLDLLVAEVAHVLATPYTSLRREPVTRLLRMHEQALRIALETERGRAQALQNALGSLPIVRLQNG